jgi:uncharacterized membrane protein
MSPGKKPQGTPSAPGRRTARRHLGLRAHLRAYFLAGVLVMAPISITLYLAWLFIDSIDDWVAGVMPARYNPETYLPFSLPGIGLLIVLATLTLVGLLTAGYLGRLVLRPGEAVLARVPVLRSLYGAIKQVFETVLDPRSKMFRQVVLVQYPRPGIWMIGFVTGATEGEAQDSAEDELINVYLPKAPGPTRGFYLLVPRRDLVVLSMSIEEGFKVLLSGGIVMPPRPGRGA